MDMWNRLIPIVEPLLGVIIGGIITLIATWLTLRHDLASSREERKHQELREWRLFQLEQIRIVQRRMWEIAILASDFEETAKAGLQAAIAQKADLFTETMKSLDPLRTKIVTLMHEMEVAAALLEDEELRAEIEDLLAHGTHLSKSALDAETFDPALTQFQSKYQQFRDSIAHRARSLMVEEL